MYTKLVKVVRKDSWIVIDCDDIMASHDTALIYAFYLSMLQHLIAMKSPCKGSRVLDTQAG